MNEAIDLIQSRYGWTDGVVGCLSFSRFLQLRNMLIDISREELNEKFILNAFIGWQMGAGAGGTFGAHLAGLGLVSSKDKPLSKPEALSADDAIKKAESILAMMAKKKEKK